MGKLSVQYSKLFQIPPILFSLLFFPLRIVRSFEVGWLRLCSIRYTTQHDVQQCVCCKRRHIAREREKSLTDDVCLVCEPFNGMKRDGKSSEDLLCLFSSCVVEHSRFD